MRASKPSSNDGSHHDGSGQHGSRHQYGLYHAGESLYTGTTKAPFSGFVRNVGVESELMHRNDILGKNESRTYIPSSTSELFRNNIRTAPHAKSDFSGASEFSSITGITTNPNVRDNGHELFHNNTRS